MVQQIDIKKLSHDEKLRMMEALWEDLSREENIVRSPDWHRETLKETEENMAAGEESVVDWEDAKLKLRKRLK